ncbi:UvrB/UvrC motif-containing protein, partial [Allisonella histaminiformans]|uniref:UvrB/UvrC motif-containing protein n=1 Tax=Allisonella histaminiformans TaxID=209880 RepID=UPI00307E6A3B
TGSMSCPSCGTTYQDFRQSGKLGCPSCYEAFREKLRPLFQQAGGSHNHTGKGPKISISKDGDADTSGSVKNPEVEKKVSPEVAELNKKLLQCIKEERYEDAARIRDEIKRISGGEV